MLFGPFSLALAAVAGIAAAGAMHHGLVALRRTSDGPDQRFAVALASFTAGTIAIIWASASTDVGTVRFASQLEVVLFRPFWFAWVLFVAAYARPPAWTTRTMLGLEVLRSVVLLATLQWPFLTDVTRVDTLLLPWGEAFHVPGGTPLFGRGALLSVPILHVVYVGVGAVTMLLRHDRRGYWLALSTVLPAGLVTGERISEILLRAQLPPMATVSIVFPLLLLWSELSERIVSAANAQEALAERERAISTVLDSVTDAVLSANPAGIVTRANPVARTWFRDAVGRPLGDVVQLVEKESRKRLTLTATSAVNGQEALLLLADKELAVSVSQARVRDEQQRDHGCVLVVRDRSEQALVEEQLRQSRKLDAIGQLAGGIAHDFNNILTGISASAHVLLSSARGEERRDVTLILESCQRAGDLTHKLLSFSRKTPAVKRRRNVDELLSGAVALLERSLGPHVEIILEVRAQQLEIECEVAQVESAILNLALNARDAMPNGGKLTFRLERLELAASTICGAFVLEPGVYAALSVSDTGTGIATEHLQKIFDPFFTTKEAGRGTGLGLSAVFGTMGEHRGAVDVESRLGVGTTFRLFFPVARADGLLRRTSSTRQRRVSIRPLDVLLVDDDPQARRSTARLLGVAGHAVVQASGGAEALERVRENPFAFDVVMLDMLMPEMDGLQTFRALRAVRPDLPVLIYSGYADDELLQPLLAHEAVEFVAKPFQRDDLLEKLKSVAEREVSLVVAMPIAARS